MYYFFKIFYSTWHKAYQLGIQIQLTENWFTPGVIVRVPECDHIVNSMKIHYFIFNFFPYLWACLYKFWWAKNYMTPREETLVVCLFVCLWFYENCLHIWGRHYYRCGAANFDLCLALIAIELRGAFSLPHLLWHGPSLYMVIPEDPWHSHLLPID